MGTHVLSNLASGSPVIFAGVVVGLMVGAGLVLGGLTSILLALLGVRGASRKNGEV